MWQKHVAFLLITIVVTALGPALASASAGVGITPGKLHFENGSQSSTQSLYVINTGTQRSEYRVFAEEEYLQWFQINPGNFTLEPNQSKEVKVSVTHPANAVGEHSTKICVTAFAKSAEDQVGTGVKIPTHISIDSNEIQNGAGIRVPASISVVSTGLEEETQMPLLSVNSKGLRLWIYIPSVITAFLATAILIMIYRRKNIASP